MDETAWSFGDLPRLTQSMEVLQQAIDGFEEDVRSRKRAATELQSQVLKGMFPELFCRAFKSFTHASSAETKREEAARFIRARKDPEFAKMVRVRQLGPEQQENQKKILGSQQASPFACRGTEGISDGTNFRLSRTPWRTWRNNSDYSSARSLRRSKADLRSSTSTMISKPVGQPPEILVKLVTGCLYWITSIGLCATSPQFSLRKAWNWTSLPSRSKI